MNINTTSKAKEFINKNKKDQNLYFCLLVKGGGCAGLSYEFLFKPENELRESNMINISNDDSFDIWTTKSALIYLMDCELRYDDNLNSKGLEVYNPHAQRTCACGVSFSV